MNDLKIIVVISVLLVSGLFVNQAFGSTNSIWELKEQAILGAFPTGCTFTNSTTDLNVDIDTAGLSHCIVFKSFNKTDVINEILNVTWSGSFIGLGLDHDITVLDGTYDRTDEGVGDFPTNVGAFGFSDGIPALKGGGILHTIARSSPFTNQTDSITMTLAGSVLPNVTIAIKIRDGSGANSVHMDIQNVTITNLANWFFDETNPIITTNNPSFEFGFTDTRFVDTQDFILPVITILGDNPILHLQNTVYTDAGATALDNVDGDVTSDIVTLSNVNSSVVGFFQVTYNVNDSNLNSATEGVRTVQVVEVMPVFAGGGGSGIALPNPEGKGGTTPISKIEDVPILTTPVTPEPITIDRAFDLFATLNQLFAPTEPIPIPLEEQPLVTPTEPVPEPVVREESFFDSIRSFFSSLFG